MATVSGISLAAVGLGFGVWGGSLLQSAIPSLAATHFVFLPFFFLAEIVPDTHTPTRISLKVSLRALWIWILW